ncbi:MAG: c-type cytochrome [Acidobacteria bacterium]|nr:c-type cytochrome [Acidobacteriota bacterium]
MTRTAWLILVLTLAATGPLSAQGGDAESGKELLEMRRCTDCHALAGQGGKTAPDLAQMPAGGYSPAGLAATLWDHAPKMWQAMEASGKTPTGLRVSDIANLYAFFYSLEFQDPAGDADAGKRVFSAKGCAKCHALPGADDDKMPGAPVARWTSMADPTLWLQEMWNHADAMRAAVEAAGMEWPTLTAEEMANVVALVRTIPPHDGLVEYIRLGDPANGEAVFAKQGCAGCHSFREEAGKRTLSTAREEPRLSGLAAALWSHYPLMRKAGASFQPLELDEMADLTTYLFRQGYYQTRGDASRGEKLIAEKKCTQCHGANNPDIPAPDLTSVGPYSAAEMASTVWTHGPNMKMFMDYLETEWPQISEQEMADLIAYLNQ